MTFRRIAPLASALLATALVSRAALITRDINFDINDGFHNPSYGTIFYSAPADTPIGSLTDPFTLQAGDTFQLNFNFLPGQALKVQYLTGQYTQQFYLNLYEYPAIVGVIGTFDLAFHGVSGTPVATTFSGSLNGQNTLLVRVPGPLTQSEFSYTGFTVNVSIDGFRQQGATSFSPDYIVMQTYGDHVGVGTAAQPVPDRTATAALLGLPLALLIWSRRRRS